MRYTVTWREDAQNQLARIWMEATDREAVRQASDEIDLLFATSSRARRGDHQGVYEFTRWP
jgi:plasmid stabilization system protein ParE